MKHFIIGLLMLAACDKIVKKEITTGSVYCESSGGSMRFTAIERGYGHNTWVEFVTENKQVITTSFPCAIIWDKE